MSVIFQACLQPDREHVIVQCHRITATPGPQDTSLSHQFVPSFLVRSTPKDKWGRRAKDLGTPCRESAAGAGTACLAAGVCVACLSPTGWEHSQGPMGLSLAPACISAVPISLLLCLCLSGLRLLVRGVTQRPWETQLTFAGRHAGCCLLSSM